MWRVPESDLNLLPDLQGKDAIELGCGTGYVSAWMVKRGARVVAIDNSQQQIATARHLQVNHEIHYEIIHGNAETVPYPDSSFDFAVSEYGAAIWCDPHKWIPEAARLLRRGGRLLFLGNTALSVACAPYDPELPTDERLIRPFFHMHRFDWGPEDGIEFHLPHGKMIDLLHSVGLKVERLVEIQAPDGPEETLFLMPRSWARKWPAEEAWVAVKQ
jgi:SAM-dependent methyltransferase